MTSLRVFAIVATMGALLLGISACVRGLPEVEEYCDELDCNALLHCCDDVRCHWCCEDRDCERGENCENYECVPREGAPPGLAPGSQPVGEECSTDHDCLEKLHCCDDYTCEECCYDMHCDQGENCEYYKCVPIEEPPEPEPDEEAQPTPAPETELVLPFILREFEEKYNDSFNSGDPVALGEIFHDAVNDLYGLDQCQAYADSVIGNHVNIKVLDWTGPEAWTWEIDGRTIYIEGAFTVHADLYASGDYTGTHELEFHSAVRADSSLGFFTDCGDPLPLPVEPECRSDQDCLEGSRCNAHGECEAEEQQSPDWVSITGINPPGLFGWPEAYAMPGSIPTIDDCGRPPEETVHHVCDRGQELASAPVDAQGNFVLLFPWPGVGTGWVWGGLTLWDNEVRGFIGAPIDFEPDGTVEDGVRHLDAAQLTIVFECPHP